MPNIENAFASANGLGDARAVIAALQRRATWLERLRLDEIARLLNSPYPRPAFNVHDLVDGLKLQVNSFGPDDVWGAQARLELCVVMCHPSLAMEVVPLEHRNIELYARHLAGVLRDGEFSDAVERIFARRPPCLGAHRMDPAPAARRLHLRPVVDEDDLAPPTRAKVMSVWLRGFVYNALGAWWLLVHGYVTLLPATLFLFMFSVAFVVMWISGGHYANPDRTAFVILGIPFAATLVAFGLDSHFNARSLATQWRLWGSHAMFWARRLARNSAFVESMLANRSPFVLLLREWDTSEFGKGKVIDESKAARWARIAASVLPVVALEEPGTVAVPGVLSPAVPKSGWEPHVHRLITAAHAIVLIVESNWDSRGLKVELEALRRSERLGDVLVFDYSGFPSEIHFPLRLKNQGFSSENDHAADVAVTEWLRTGDPASIRRLPSYVR
jgi:hypothetical protein